MIKTSPLYYDKIRTHLSASAEIKHKTSEQSIDSILQAIQLISDTFKAGRKILLCGNGGSAADCQHLAGEFVCLLNKNFYRPALPAIALTTDSSVMTAFSNDFGYDRVFERQVQALGKPKDLLIGISTSGSSQNVILAFKAAKLAKMYTLALTGNGGSLQEFADVSICVPSTNTQYIQETHLSIEHIICELVEYKLFVKRTAN